MRASKKPPRPNHAQAQWLRRIARSGGMMRTRRQGMLPAYDLLGDAAAAVPPQTAEVLIRHGWLRAERDGLIDDTQTFRVLTP